MTKRVATKRFAKRGRPRGFDERRALDRAMKVFWRKGYEGTSVNDLTRATGINRPSLYGAFGNKAALFRKVLDRYESHDARVCDALNAPTARAVAERLLYGAADSGTQPGRPRGCMLVQAALACGDESEAIRRDLCARRAAGETALRDRFAFARRTGDLPRHASATDLARYIITVLHGMSVQATGGASRAQLRRVASRALRAWPT